MIDIRSIILVTMCSYRCDYTGGVDLIGKAPERMHSNCALEGGTIIDYHSSVLITEQRLKNQSVRMMPSREERNASRVLSVTMYVCVPSQHTCIENFVAVSVMVS